jgi:CRISPR-associated protein Cas2
MIGWFLAKVADSLGMFDRLVAGFGSISRGALIDWEVGLMLVLVVYDVPDNKRRTKLAKFLEGYGRRVQFSVFECFLSLDEMQQLYGLVERKIKVEEDNVRFYWISRDAVSRTLTLGSPAPEEPPSVYII